MRPAHDDDGIDLDDIRTVLDVEILSDRRHAGRATDDLLEAIGRFRRELTPGAGVDVDERRELAFAVLVALEAALDLRDGSAMRGFRRVSAQTIERLHGRVTRGVLFASAQEVAEKLARDVIQHWDQPIDVIAARVMVEISTWRLFLGLPSPTMNWRARFDAIRVALRRPHKLGTIDGDRENGARAMIRAACRAVGMSKRDADNLFARRPRADARARS